MEKLFQLLLKLGLMPLVVRFSRQARIEILKSCNNKPEMIPNQLAYIDMVTDSLMHRHVRQYRFLGKGDVEANFIQLDATLKRFFGYNFVYPVSQGRFAEMLFSKAFIKPKTVVYHNELFITTLTHLAQMGAKLQPVAIPEAYDPFCNYPFKGNVDLILLEKLLSENPNACDAIVYIEAAANATGGHPISLANLEALALLKKKFGFNICLDGSRILSNAIMLQEREEEVSNMELPSIIRSMCSLADGCVMSATKDFRCASGGILAINDPEKAELIGKLVLLYGDGLSIRQKAILNKAIRFRMKTNKGCYRRMKQIRRLHQNLSSSVQIISPASTFGIFISYNSSHGMQVNKDMSEEFLRELYLETGVAASAIMMESSQAKRIGKVIRLALPSQGLKGFKLRYLGSVLRSINF